MNYIKSGKPIVGRNKIMFEKASGIELHGYNYEDIEELYEYGMDCRKSDVVASILHYASLNLKMVRGLSQELNDIQRTESNDYSEIVEEFENFITDIIEDEDSYYNENDSKCDYRNFNKLVVISQIFERKDWIEVLNMAGVHGHPDKFFIKMVTDIKIVWDKNLKLREKMINLESKSEKARKAWENKFREAKIDVDFDSD